jgi:hypothetical protein
VQRLSFGKSPKTRSLPARTCRDLTVVSRALGSPISGTEVHGVFPRAARDTFSSHLAKDTPSHKPFRFILVSGALIPRTEVSKLAQVPVLNVFQERGKVELEFEEFEHNNKDTWKSIIVRPQAVVAGGSWAETLAPSALSIQKELFAAALVDLAIHGTEGQLLDNASLKQRGERAEARKTKGGLGTEPK